jgi:hypothetical protein
MTLIQSLAAFPQASDEDMPKARGYTIYSRALEFHVYRSMKTTFTNPTSTE